MTKQPINNGEAARYLQCAQEMRRRAEAVADEKIRLATLRIAEDYEALADLADEVSRRQQRVKAALAVYKSNRNL